MRKEKHPARPIYTVNGRRWSTKEFLAKLTQKQLETIAISLCDHIIPIHLSPKPYRPLRYLGAILYTGDQKTKIVARTLECFLRERDAVTVMERLIKTIYKDFCRAMRGSKNTLFSHA